MMVERTNILHEELHDSSPPPSPYNSHRVIPSTLEEAQSLLRLAYEELDALKVQHEVLWCQGCTYISMLTYLQHAHTHIQGMSPAKRNSSIMMKPVSKSRKHSDEYLLSEEGGVAAAHSSRPLALLSRVVVSSAITLELCIYVSPTSRSL